MRDNTEQNDQLDLAVTTEPALAPEGHVQEAWLDVINAGHGVVTTPSNYDHAEFERFQRIYSEGEPLKVTGNVKIV